MKRGSFHHLIVALGGLVALTAACRSGPSAEDVRAGIAASWDGALESLSAGDPNAALARCDEGLALLRAYVSRGRGAEHEDWTRTRDEVLGKSLATWRDEAKERFATRFAWSEEPVLEAVRSGRATQSDVYAMLTACGGSVPGELAMRLAEVQQGAEQRRLARVYLFRCELEDGGLCSAVFARVAEACAAPGVEQASTAADPADYVGTVRLVGEVSEAGRYRPAGVASDDPGVQLERSIAIGVRGELVVHTSRGSSAWDGARAVDARVELPAEVTQWHRDEVVRRHHAALAEALVGDLPPCAWQAPG